MLDRAGVALEDLMRQGIGRIGVAAALGATLLVPGVILTGCHGEESSRQTPQASAPTGGAPVVVQTDPALLVSVPVVKADPASVEGNFELVNSEVMVGWVMDKSKPNQTVAVDLYDGAILLVSVPAGEFRQDLLDAGKGNGKHAFKALTPTNLKDHKPHTIHAKCAGVELSSSPKTFQEP